ncbi:methyltransferase [Azonexus sp.]|uniref:methyltransferase n=1 Tax=Azonexus sp. TaxID=1872668 RepID=UPI0039E22D90
MNDLPPYLEWSDQGRLRRARWRSEAGLALPQVLEMADESWSLAAILDALRSGRHLLWRGDWIAARRLLQALTPRADQLFRFQPAASPAATFARHRAVQGERAALLARLLVPLGPDYKLQLARAQDVRAACRAAWGKPDGNNSVVALREVLALVSASEWQKKGVPVPAAGGRIHPRYGVFSPLRGEYIDLVATALLPSGAALAFDIGTGSGVLAAVLARRGLQVVATDLAARALECAADNMERLGLAGQVSVVKADLFPPGRAAVVVCNPPWLPAQPTSPVEMAVYDPDSRMLRGFLQGLAAHLLPGGEGWLILSDLAEHLLLRSRHELEQWIDAAGLRIIGRLDTRPGHAKAQDAGDPLHAARAAEVTSLWRLVVQ